MYRVLTQKERHEETRTAFLKLTHWLIRSRWKVRRISVLWSRRHLVAQFYSHSVQKCPSFSAAWVLSSMSCSMRWPRSIYRRSLDRQRIEQNQREPVTPGASSSSSKRSAIVHSFISLNSIGVLRQHGTSRRCCCLNVNSPGMSVLLSNLVISFTDRAQA